MQFAKVHRIARQNVSAAWSALQGSTHADRRPTKGNKDDEIPLIGGHTHICVQDLLEEQAGMVDNGVAKVVVEFLKVRDQRTGTATELVPNTSATALAKQFMHICRFSVVLVFLCICVCFLSTRVRC